jgi:hypothetical protein
MILSTRPLFSSNKKLLRMMKNQIATLLRTLCRALAALVVIARQCGLGDFHYLLKRQGLILG